MKGKGRRKIALYVVCRFYVSFFFNYEYFYTCICIENKKTHQLIRIRDIGSIQRNINALENVIKEEICSIVIEYSPFDRLISS